MAVSTGNLGASVQGVAPAIPGSVTGDWTTIHSDASATASTQALTPLSETSANVKWLKVPNRVVRVLVRCRYPTGASSLVTSPVIKLYGAWPGVGATAATKTEPPFATDGTVKIMRLDNVDSGAAGVTVTLDFTNDIGDATYKYSDPTSLDGYDLKGAAWIACLVTTAGAATGFTTPIIEVLGLN